VSSTQQPGPQPPLEYQQWAHEKNIEQAHRAHDAMNDFAIKTNSAAIEGANLALRTVMIVNGGAAISVLAFIGGLASRDKVSITAITQTASTLIWFAFGVASATLSLGLAYFTNLAVAASGFTKEKTFVHPFIQDTTKSRRYRRWAEIFRWLAIVGAFASLVLFICGMLAVKCAVSSLGK
jgi:hypothetical protein